MTAISKIEFFDWLEDSHTVKLDKFNHAGDWLSFVGWRFYFDTTTYGARCVDETGETFHVLSENVQSYHSNSISTVWACYDSCVLVYGR